MVPIWTAELSFSFQFRPMREFKFPLWELGEAGFCLQRAFQAGEEGKAPGSPLSLGEAVRFRRPHGPPEATPASLAHSYRWFSGFFFLFCCYGNSLSKGCWGSESWMCNEGRYRGDRSVQFQSWMKAWILFYIYIKQAQIVTALTWKHFQDGNIHQKTCWCEFLKPPVGTYSIAVPNAKGFA